MIGFVFVFLPHFPADITARQDKYQATTTRLGWEWVLTPLMVYQNYHLIHHLYPNVPFYNYIKIWHLRYEEISRNNPAIQKGFNLRPVGR
jgi:fatty acid desaturase